MDFPENDAFLTEELLRIALDSSGVAMWKIDPAARSIEWTTALRRMFGVQVEEKLAYDDFFTLLHPDDAETTRLHLDAALTPGGGACDTECRIVLPSGEVKWAAITGRAVFARDGAGLLIGTMRDVTDSKAVAAALQATLDQKQLLLQELNHRIKNSLQLVTSLLRLQIRRIDDPASRHNIEDATARISTIAHIHQRLYRDQDIERLDFGAFLSELCADLQGASPRCRLTVHAPHISVPTDRAIPLALIANELVNNAFKYAYPENAGGPVSVGIARVDPDAIEIRVSDQGEGLPVGFEVKTAKSLGMILVSSLAQQLAAKIVIAETDKGATVVVTAPIEENPRGS
jgi:PAS domain S-box-containing protein